MKDKNNLEPGDYKTSVSNTLNQEAMHEIDEDLQKAIDKELYKNAKPTGVYIDKELSPLGALNNLTQLAFNYAELDEHFLSNAKRYHGTIKNALKEFEKIEFKQNTINDFYPNTKEMINDLLNLVCTKVIDNLKDGELYTKSRVIEILGFAIRYVKTFTDGNDLQGEK